MWIQIIVLIWVNCQLDVRQLPISSTRHPNRTTICASTSYSPQQQTNNYLNLLNSQFSNENPYLSLSQNATLSLSLNTALSSSQLLLSIPFIIIFLLFLIIPFFLCCCCLCPTTCPCKALRNPPDHVYTNNELRWPTVLGIIFWAIVGCTSVASVLKVQNLVDSYSYIGCRVIALGDDMSRGMVGQQNTSFWSGLQPISKATQTLVDNISSISKQSSTVFSNIPSLQSYSNSSLTAIKSIYPWYSNSIYSNTFKDISGNDLTSNVQSQFKQLFLGPETKQGTVLGNVNLIVVQMFEQVGVVIQKMYNSSENIKEKINGEIQTNLKAGITSSNSVVTELDAYITTMFNLFGVDNGLTTLQNLLIALFSLSIISSVTIAAFLICINCCGTLSFKYFLNAFCTLIIILGLLISALTVTLSVAVPNVFQGCLVLNEGVKDSSKFQNIGIGLKISQVSSRVGVCLRSGQLLQQISDSYSQNINDIKRISQFSLNFTNKTLIYSNDSIYKAIQKSKEIIANIKNNVIFDINDTRAIQYLSYLSERTIIPSPSCNNYVRQDSWIPSFAAPFPQCKSGSHSRSLCIDISNITQCPSGCYPFTDQLNTNKAGDSLTTDRWFSDLSTRYGSTTCNYARMVSDVKNWDISREARMQSLLDEMGKSNGMQDQIGKYISEMTNLQAAIKTFSSTLTNSYGGIVNLETGVFAGLNCQPLKQDVQLIVDGICVYMFNEMFFLFITGGVISIGVLLGACFTTWSMVRHSRQMEQLKKLYPVDVTQQMQLKKN